MTVPVPTNSPSTPSNCTPVTYPTLPHSSCLVYSYTGDLVVAILIIMLVVYTFYRMYGVWAGTLNFTEVSVLWEYGEQLTKQGLLKKHN